MRQGAALAIRWLCDEEAKSGRYIRLVVSDTAQIPDYIQMHNASLFEWEKEEISRFASQCGEFMMGKMTPGTEKQRLEKLGKWLDRTDGHH